MTAAVAARRTIAAATMLIAGSAFAAAGEEVALETPTGTLHGTLLFPDVGRKVDTVLIHPGSGPVDRDGNAPGLTSNGLRLLAAALAERGVASLRIDKRGVGRSAGALIDPAALRIETYVADTVLWRGLLRRRPRVGRIFLAGHSEGALIVTLAAQRTRVSGLVLIAGAGYPGGETIRRQLADRSADEDTLREAERLIDALERGRTAPPPPGILRNMLPKSVQPYAISWFRYDPATELAKLDVPALILQGGNDLQITARDAARLATSRPGARFRVFPDMNHVLKKAPSDVAGNFATYDDPALPLAPGLADAVAEFVTH